MNTLWYFGLEPLKSRYTEQLSEHWMPAAFKRLLPKNWQFKHVRPAADSHVPEDVKVGSVLDSVGRSRTSLAQCMEFQRLIAAGVVKDGDKIYLQDFWTPGIESVFYSLDVYGIREVQVYAMCHAQSVDQYDFTYPMRDWMRSYERGLCNWMSVRGGAIFCASTIHMQHMHEGWGRDCPLIHVVSLPLDYSHLIQNAPTPVPYGERPKKAVYSSRLDPEKNPGAAITMASALLDRGWQVVFTTSLDRVRTDEKSLALLDLLQQKYPDTFSVLTKQTKEDYYRTLGTSRIQFNTSAQDYVSWTLLEAAAMGCDIVYPDHRSFLECVPEDRRYTPFQSESFLRVVDRIEKAPRQHHHLATQASIGRLMTAYLTLHGVVLPFNIWQDSELINLTSFLEYEK